MEGVSDEIKGQMLLPAINDLLETQSSTDHIGFTVEQYATLLVSSLDKSLALDMNTQGSSSWPVFKLILRYIFSSGACYLRMANQSSNLHQIRYLSLGLFLSAIWSEDFSQP